MNTRARWRDMHFSRRLGATVPNADYAARYAAAVEEPAPRRFTASQVAWVLAVVIAVVVLVLVIPGGPQ